MTVLVFFLVAPTVVTVLLALTLQGLAQMSALKVARTLAAIPSGLGLVMLVASIQAHESTNPIMLAAAAFMVLMSSLGPWLVALFFWRQARPKSQPEQEGPGFSRESLASRESGDIRDES